MSIHFSWNIEGIKWWNSMKTFVNVFSQRRRHMPCKNTIEISSIYWNVLPRIFQTDVLINFFIPLNLAEAITWENFVPAKWDPGVQKRGPVLPGWSFSNVIAGYNLRRVHNTTGNLAKRDRISSRRTGIM